MVLPSMPVISLDLLEFAISLECGMYCPLTGPARLHSCGLYAAIVDDVEIDASGDETCSVV